MRTCTFKSVVYLAAARRNLKPYSEDDLDIETFAELAAEINNWVREGWTFDWWPECIETEARTVETASDSVLYVPWAATGKTTIGSVLEVYKNNPLVNRYPWRIPWTLNKAGVVVNDLAPDIVYITFRRRVPEFTHEPYDTSTTYSTGDLVYDGETGECYESVADSNSGNDLTDTDYWTQMEFPVWLRAFVSGMAYASTMDDEDQENARVKVESRAYHKLQDMADVEVAGQGAVVTAHVNVG